jgi:hypothetical protein
MAGGKGSRKLARIYLIIMVLFAIIFMIVQLAKKKVNEMNMIVMVIILSLVLITNPIIPIVFHPAVKGAIMGIPLLIMFIFCMIAVAKR